MHNKCIKIKNLCIKLVKKKNIMVMDLRVPQNAANFFTNEDTQEGLCSMVFS